jgi:glycine cleavage system transcriptional repressor
MAILGGHFTMMLIVSAADDADVDALRAELLETQADLSLGALTLERVSGDDGAARPEPSHVVTVYGADHPGIVHSVTATLAAAGVNILDVATRLVTEEGRPAIYAMMMEVQVPAGLAADAMEADLRQAADRERLDLSVRAVEADPL